MQLQNFLPLFIVTFFVSLSFLFFRTRPEDQTQNQDRDLYLDGVRGLAAIAVVATHFWRLAAQGINYKFDFALRENYGSLAVQVFFCITGLLFFGQMYAKSGVFDWSKFYTSRFRRIMPAYAAYFLLNVIAICAVGDWSAFKSTQIYYLLDMAFLGLKGNGNDFYALGIEIDRFFSVIWTLAYEVKFYLAFPFIVWASFTKYGEKLAFPFGGILVAYELVATGTTFAGYFLIGALAAKYLRHIRLSPKYKAVFSAISVIALYFSLSHEYSPYGWERYLLTAALFCSIVVARPKLMTLRPLTALGDMSYSVYLVHAPLLMLSGFALKHLIAKNPGSDTQFLLITFCATALVFFISHLSYKYVESPFLRKTPAVTKKTTEPALSQ
ncbi:acyltransferase family protein [Pseudomonas sp. LF245]